MDFGTLLHVAKKNSENNKSSEGKYYSTKFSAPKKESKEKKLSDNIKKFLAKKEAEEREKARIEKEKRDRLLTLRDEKSKNKIKKMLKVIKSANKSVLEDAIDNENTAITLHGMNQPDEDDYGYVSQEAAALYQKYMDRVNSLPEENKFAPSRPASRTDLTGTKDRVRAALQKEQDEKNNPSRSKLSKPTSNYTSSTTTTTTTSSYTTLTNNSHKRKDLYDSQVEREIEERKRREEQEKKSKFKKPPPSQPFDFKELLKLAEKKQHEPVEIVIEPKKEPERLLTKKEKKEQEERRLYLEQRERRKKEAQNPSKMQSIEKTPKQNSAPDSSNSFDDKKSNSSIRNSKVPSSSSSKLSSSSKETFKKPVDQNLTQKTPSNSKSMSKMENKNSASSSNNSVSSTLNGTKTKLNGISSNNNINSKNSNLTNSRVSYKPPIGKPSSLPVAKSSGALSLQQSKNKSDGLNRALSPKRLTEMKKKAMLHSKDTRTREFPSPSHNERTRQFPPPDVKNSKIIKKPMKRRIVDDDEDEYDSELDDFIDDGPQEDQNYSNYIKEIFGYDKSKYREMDVDEDDEGAMESSFAQQMREEYVSKKIGLLEDLEDMRLEAEEKKRKALMKKRKIK